MRADYKNEKNKKDSLLIVIGSLDSGGAEHQLFQILPELVKCGWSITLYLMSSRGELADLIESKGVKLAGPGSFIYKKGREGGVHRLIKGVIMTLGLLKYLLTSRPSVLHFVLPEAYLIGGICGILIRHDKMLMSRRSLNKYQDKYVLINSIERFLHGKMKLIIANSKAVANDLVNEKVSRMKIRVIYNGVCLNKYTAITQRKEIREKNNFSADSLIFIVVANLIQYKGHRDLIRALGLIKDKMPTDWNLICVGRDDGVGYELKELAKLERVHSHVHWLGEREDVADLYNAADIGLLCSYQEGFSNAILEGMAASLPMIVTDVGGNAEAVVDGETGYVIPSHNPEKIAEALQWLIKDKNQRLQMGNAGRMRVQEKFSLSECIKKYEMLYKEVIA